MTVPEMIAFGAVWYPVFLFSTTLHEAAHAWVAKLGGDDTAYKGGQVSLNPMPHIRRSILGMVIVPLILIPQGWLIGWASTPFDPHWAARHPKRAAVMSLAGPAGNLSLVLLSTGLIWSGLALGWFVPPDMISMRNVVVAIDPGMNVAALVLSAFFSLNLILLVFNLVPLPPLDGSGALPLILPARMVAKVEAAFAQPMWGILAFLLAWKVFRGVFPHVHDAALHVLYWPWL